jgi:flagellar protein FliO/FliZ
MIPTPLIRLAFAATLDLAPAAAWPQQPAATAAPAVEPGGSFLGELLAILLPLALVIVVLIVVLRLVRRRYGLSGGDAPLSVVQIVPLGPRERLVLVKTRSGRVFTVGVGLHAVHFVTDIDPRDLEPPPATPPPDQRIHTSRDS